MIYEILKQLFKIAQFFYFKKAKRIGIEKIPLNEANILISNHPSSFQDPIVGGTHLKKQVYFLTAEEFMGKGLAYKIINTQFNAIPIYRRTTRPDEVHKNKDSFSECYKALAEFKNIQIYPEGFSDTQIWLGDIKTGTARIAIDTLKKYPELNKINIIPLGLNYSNPHQFRSTFLLNVGDIIEIKQKHNFDKDSLTKLCYKNLNESINGIDIDETDWQEIIYYIQKNNQTTTSLPKGFELDRKFIKKLNSAKTNNQTIFSTLKKKTLDLKQELEKNKITIKEALLLNNPPHHSVFKQIVLTLLMIPGYVINSLPLLFIKQFVAKKEMKYSFIGGFYFGLGTFSSLIWQLIFVFIASFFIGWFSLLIPFVMIGLGYITLLCRDYLAPINEYKKLKSKFRISSDLKKLFHKVDMSIEKL